MAKEDRHYLGAGVAIQRRGKVWWIDVYRAGERFRDSLETPDGAVAVTIGGAVLELLQKHERAIHQLAELIPALRQIRPQAMARMLALTDGDPDFRRSMEEAWKLIPEFPEEALAKWEGGLISRLRGMALDGVRAEDMFRRVVKETVLCSPPTVPVSWEDALERFAKSKTGKVVPETLKNILRDVREFIAFAKVPHVGDATSALVDEWVSALQAADAKPKPAKPKTAWNKRVSLSSFFTWAVRTAKIIGKNPVADTDPPKVDPPDPQYLTSDQFTERMKQIEGMEWEWVPGLSALGLRLGDIVRLDPPRDIDIRGRNIRVRKGKTGQRNVVILDQMVKYARMVPKEGFAWTDKHISSVTCAMGVGNHLLRHTIETHLRLNGVYPQAVGDFWLGHDGRTGAKHYAGWWRPSEPPMKLTYFGLPLVGTGIPVVPPEVREAFKA